MLLQEVDEESTTTMKVSNKVALCCVAISSSTADSFAPSPEAISAVQASSSSSASTTALNFFGGGSGAKDLDEEWERQQELLKLRQAPAEEREKYFEGVEARRMKATQEQTDKWAWQKKQYGKGEDPIDEWRKRRASGQISDLDNQYGDPKKVGGIPIPMASFGVGGEFGVGGKFDNGGRFDLRLPYAEQGYVDEERDNNPFSSLFGGGKKKKETEEKEVQSKEEPAEAPKKNGFWPF